MVEVQTNLPCLFLQSGFQYLWTEIWSRCSALVARMAAVISYRNKTAEVVRVPVWWRILSSLLGCLCIWQTLRKVVEQTSQAHHWHNTLADPEQAAIAPSTEDTAVPSLRTQDMHFYFLELKGFQHDGREMVLQVSTVSQVTGWMQTCPQPRSQPLSLCHPLFHQTPTHWGGHEIHSVWETCHTSSQELKLCRSNLDSKLDSSAFESI